MKQKVYSIINIAGLAIGMMACFLILFYIQDELSYDQFHEKADQIYRVVGDLKIPSQFIKTAIIAPPLAPALMRNFPEVQSATRILPLRTLPDRNKALVSYREKRFIEEGIFYADSTLFDIFSFPFLLGNPSTALQTPYSIVITESMMNKYFGLENPLGKSLTIDGEQDYKISGVIKNVPSNSHFRFDFVASFHSLNQTYGNYLENWNGNSVYTYLLLEEKSAPSNLENKLPAFYAKYAHAMVASITTLRLQPITSIHLHSHRFPEIEANGDIKYIYLFSAITFFVFLIACFNYINLTTARYTARTKEIAMRKIVGAHRSQLIIQFLGESLLFACLALLVAIVLTELFLPYFGLISGKELSAGIVLTPHMLSVSLTALLLVGMFAGSYPAIFLSRFDPSMIMNRTMTRGFKNLFLRKGLVILQFVVSIILIIGTGVIANQMDYLSNKKLGFQKEHIIVIPLDDSRSKSEIKLLKQRYLNNSSIIAAAASSGGPGRILGNWRFHPEGFSEDTPWSAWTLFVDSDFIHTLDIELTEGRPFSKNLSIDSLGFIINETAVKELGWLSPLGKTLAGAGKEGPVIGVAKNFHFTSLHKEIEPMVLTINPRKFAYLFVRIHPADILGTINFLQKTWQEFHPERPFDYFFLDDDFDQQYRAEQRLRQIFGLFSLIAIFIACLGLFGLVSFSAEKRTKEIGVRKVLGASVSSIVLLLSKEFTKWVLLANLIAWPIAYFAMNNWLQNFAYRIDIGFGTFILAGILALAIALLTVSTQAIRAALANPVKSLRYE